MWTTVVCKIVELDELLLCSPSAKGILMYWPVELGRWIFQLADNTFSLTCQTGLAFLDRSVHITACT